MPLQIQRIKPEQIAEAKRVILLVARGVYQWPETLEQIIQRFDEQGNLRDIDDVQATYFDHRGLFLVAVDQGRVIGTGAIRQIDAENAELKRMWLLDTYQGQGIGYQLVMELFRFARNEGYQRVRLQADIRSQRAIHFYQRLGFQPMDCVSDDPDDICMEMAISASENEKGA